MEALWLETPSRTGASMSMGDRAVLAVSLAALVFVLTLVLAGG